MVTYYINRRQADVPYKSYPPEGIKPTQQRQEKYIFIHTPNKSLARSNPKAGAAAPFIDFLRFSYPACLALYTLPSHPVVTDIDTEVDKKYCQRSCFLSSIFPKL